MKKIIPLILISIFSFSSFSQINKTVTDEKTEKPVLISECNREGFKQEEFKQWFFKEYDSYEADKKVLKKLKKSQNFEAVKIKVIFGTWCHDSQREMPRFYKIIDKIKFPESNIQLIGVDTKKESRDDLLTGIEFTRIPTFIIYVEGKEIGRIVESTKVSLESDLLDIVNK